MCRFAVRNFTCGHEALMTDPKDTVLCEAALQSGLQQGRDVAPVLCFPSTVLIENPRKEDIADLEVTFDSIPCPSCNFEELQRAYNIHWARKFSKKVDRLEGLYENAKGFFLDSEAKNHLAKVAPDSPIDQKLIRDGVPDLETFFTNDFQFLRQNLPALYDLNDDPAQQEKFNGTLDHMEKKLELLSLRVHVFLALTNILLSEKWSTGDNGELLREVETLTSEWEKLLETPTDEVDMSMELARLLESPLRDIDDVREGSRFTCYGGFLVENGESVYDGLYSQLTDNEESVADDQDSELGSVGRELASTFDVPGSMGSVYFPNPLNNSSPPLSGTVSATEALSYDCDSDQEDGGAALWVSDFDQADGGAALSSSDFDQEDGGAALKTSDFDQEDDRATVWSSDSDEEEGGVSLEDSAAQGGRNSHGVTDDQELTVYVRVLRRRRGTSTSGHSNSSRDSFSSTGPALYEPIQCVRRPLSVSSSESSIVREDDNDADN